MSQKVIKVYPDAWHVPTGRYIMTNLGLLFKPDQARPIYSGDPVAIVNVYMKYTRSKMVAGQRMICLDWTETPNKSQAENQKPG